VESVRSAVTQTESPGYPLARQSGRRSRSWTLGEKKNKNYREWETDSLVVLFVYCSLHWPSYSCYIQLKYASILRTTLDPQFEHFVTGISGSCPYMDGWFRFKPWTGSWG